MAHYYDMSTPVALPDLGVVGGNPGVGANIASNPPGMPGGNCAEFNGNNSNINLGDVTMLNAVSAFSIAFWMRQDVIDVTDIIFRKQIDGTHRIYTWTDAGGPFYFQIYDGAFMNASFDYSVVIEADTWYHVAWVFDGSQTGDANRMKCYVDANPITLSFAGAAPAVTPDLSGASAFIGLAASSFDGELDTFMFFTDPLTQLQVSDLYWRTRQGGI
jgi:hypothetical protein